MKEYDENFVSCKSVDQQSEHKRLENKRKRQESYYRDDTDLIQLEIEIGNALGLGNESVSFQKAPPNQPNNILLNEDSKE